MTPSRRKQRTTLSDLLADDVRDYFRREGVSDRTPQHPSRPKNRRRNGQSQSVTHSSRESSELQSNLLPSSFTLSTPSSLGSLRAEWSKASQTQSANNDPSRNIFTDKLQHVDGGTKLQPKSAHPRQEDEEFISHRESKQRRSSQFVEIDDDKNHNRRESLTRLHRRHGSGSGSFQSRGSVSSRGKVLSAADAEFLRRYAEEKERANLRMQAALPTWGTSRMINATAKNLDIVDSLSIASRSRPYQSLVSSSRPPTVAGSHRPGLASIGNDDWEEDDRIERKEKRKLEKKKSREWERHRRKTSSMGGDSSVGTDPSIVLHHQQYQQQMQPELYHRHQYPPNNGYYENQNGSVRSMSQSSAPYGNYGISPGNGSSTMCYSTSSSQSKPAHLRWDSFPNKGGDSDSAGTFVRIESNGNGSIRPVQGDISQKTKTHIRPLSYLSASSSDGGKSGQVNFDSENKRNNTVDSGIFGKDTSETNSSCAMTPSPQSSSMGGGGLSRFSYMSRTDGSSLVGSSIMESLSRGSEHFHANGSSYRNRQYERFGHHGRDDEESSDESSSGDSSDTSYTSDSYDGDNSSDTVSENASKSLEGSKSRRGKTWERVNFRGNNKKKVLFSSQVDVESGESKENERLIDGKVSNYSSVGISGWKSSRRNHKRFPKRRLGSPGTAPLRLDDAMDLLWEKIESNFLKLELFISNMPSLVGSLALAWVSLGVDWFKWYEETFDVCHPTDYHSAACTFPEFPGCFHCDDSYLSYRLVLHFHYLCSTISFILASFLIGKIIIAFPVVRDELANPTTAAPLGLLCMALEKCFGGNLGWIGLSITFLASAAQTAVAVWFIFISVVYKTLPEPSWFPNTTGIGLAAAKVFLYWTIGGYCLGIFSIIAFFIFYFVALYRIHANEKITAIVCWVQLSGPAVILYGFTIFGQPGSDEDEMALMIPENKEHFFRLHRKYYMPIIHLFFACCMISMCSALYCLKTRWKSFREKEFSPAHVGFCAPLISHTNAMQAYRSSLNKFSLMPSDHIFKNALYRYWTLSLIAGTILTLSLSWKFFKHLPVWCEIDVEDDEIPPEPDNTEITRLLQKGEARDAMNQDYVSAAVLQANESGALVRVLRDGKMKYVRSRRMPSMGFDLVMNTSELMSERERLLSSVKYAADPDTMNTRGSSFDENMSSSFIHDPNAIRASSRRNRMNFLSFDAATMMRGDLHHR